MIFAFFIPLLLGSLIAAAWLVLALFNRPGEAIRNVRRQDHLGPGGQDDPFADEYHDAWLRRKQAQAPAPSRTDLAA